MVIRLLQQVTTRTQRVLSQGLTRDRFIKAHCPWQNGKVERFNRTLATEWAHRSAYLSNDERTTAFTTRLTHYNNDRHDHAIGRPRSPACHQRAGRC